MGHGRSVDETIGVAENVNVGATARQVEMGAGQPNRFYTTVNKYPSAYATDVFRLRF